MLALFLALTRCGYKHGRHHGQVVYVTEKPLKPMLNLRPFVLLGSAGNPNPHPSPSSSPSPRPNPNPIPHSNLFLTLILALNLAVRPARFGREPRDAALSGVS